MPLRRIGRPVSVSDAQYICPRLSAAPGMEGRSQSVNQSTSQSVNPPKINPSLRIARFAGLSKGEEWKQYRIDTSTSIKVPIPHLLKVLPHVRCRYLIHTASPR